MKNICVEGLIQTSSRVERCLVYLYRSRNIKVGNIFFEAVYKITAHRRHLCDDDWRCYSLYLFIFLCIYFGSFRFQYELTNAWASIQRKLNKSNRTKKGVGILRLQACPGKGNWKLNHNVFQPSHSHFFRFIHSFLSIRDFSFRNAMPTYIQYLELAVLVHSPAI